MLNIKKSQLLLILAGVVVFILIYLAPRQESTTSAKNTEAVNESHAGHNHAEGEHLEKDDYFNKLSEEDRKYLDELSAQAEEAKDESLKSSIYDSLISFSIKRGVPPLVASYTEKKAEAIPSEANFMLAGDNFFKAFRLSSEKPKELIANAIKNYQKVLEINPNNLKAETAMGVASVEGSSQLGLMPMKGIGILKEVLNKDPKNVDALTNLGYFAIQSGQYEKAIERFETVLQIEPRNAEAYIYLTDVYLSQDKVEEGIETLEKYKSLVEDPLVKQQVDDYIKEIRNKK